MSDGDRSSPTWVRLRAHLEEQLRIKRAQNDDSALDQFQTAKLRGHIESLKAIIALGDMPPPIG